MRRVLRAEVPQRVEARHLGAIRELEPGAVHRPDGPMPEAPARSAAAERHPARCRAQTPPHAASRRRAPYPAREQALDARHHFRHRGELLRGLVRNCRAPNSSSSANRMFSPSSESTPRSRNVLASSTRPSGNFCVFVMTRTTRIATVSGMRDPTTAAAATRNRSQGPSLPSGRRSLRADDGSAGTLRARAARTPTTGSPCAQARPRDVERAFGQLAAPRPWPRGCAGRPCRIQLPISARAQTLVRPGTHRRREARNCSTTNGTSRDSTMRKPFSEMSHPITARCRGYRMDRVEQDARDHADANVGAGDEHRGGTVAEESAGDAGSRSTGRRAAA